MDRRWVELFDTDGALCDIVVPDMTYENWIEVLGYFHARSEVWKLRLSYGVLVRIVGSSSIGPDDRLLARGDLPGQPIAWHLDDELEIDLDPRLVDSDEHVAAIHGLMRDLGRLLDRDVTMSLEGERGAVIFAYRYSVDAVEGVGRPRSC